MLRLNRAMSIMSTYLRLYVEKKRGALRAPRAFLYLLCFGFHAGAGHADAQRLPLPILRSGQHERLGSGCRASTAYLSIVHSIAALRWYDLDRTRVWNGYETRMSAYETPGGPQYCALFQDV
jgi:hypothetical protein